MAFKAPARQHGTDLILKELQRGTPGVCIRIHARGKRGTGGEAENRQKE
jgi:hypothetical protein